MSMENVKVSVIVPVYNVEKYLPKCLESLVSQTLPEIEIIVVNDGSPDRSQEIIDQFCEKYPDKVRGFIKENGGLGDARNYGLHYARGEYIGFVDSDDWVDEKMFQTLYETAKREDDDIVICDFVEINDGWTQGKVSYGYRGDRTAYPIEKYMFLLNSMNPAVAWNKIYRRSLFDVVQFANCWYEDIATTPILLSYANKIGYTSIAFYYYRQTEKSITKSNSDNRNLGVIDAWKRCLTLAKKEYMEPIEATTYYSIQTFVYFKPEFADDYLNFFFENKERFLMNKVIKKQISQHEIEDLSQKKLIPPILHFFWFGYNPKSELIQRCIESWKKHAPNFQIREWNEENCDIHANKYVEEAYQAKKWAFVADYFRLKVIEQYGGIYLDTDTELMQNPSMLRLNKAFFAFETKDAVHAGIFGAIPHHPLVKKCVDSYDHEHFLEKDGYNTSFTIVRRISEELRDYKIEFNGNEQLLKDDVHIYPANKLTLDMYDGQIIAQHHYDCSWWDVKTGVVSYKNTVLRDFFSNNIVITNSEKNEEIMRMLNYYKTECERYESSTCWKITKPLRIMMDFFKKIVKG